jgi:hypothetical protein
MNVLSSCAAIKPEQIRATIHPAITGGKNRLDRGSNHRPWLIS